ncbi:hypothetical protein GCM10010832_22180 [Psychroflexus planctonicus]|uniref:Uncharacterized protein n=1 Tax=Psychroflexus planctonicus TaxID=1526575 RepID=A0ABQ1SL41_9FLAO|nr:hypothetical protein GCM10010832_22180 [Psychroflexus planctonicus]
MFSLHTTAQEITKAKKINDSIIGEVFFQYYLNNQDTIYNGNFEFNSTQKVKDQEDVVSYNYVGKYQENQKTGKWVFSKKELTPQKKFKEKNYKVTFSTSGSEFKINGNFKDGLADGDWQVVNQKFESSNPTDTLYSISSKFKNAKMVAHFSAASNRVNIDGNFTEDGLLDGNWEIIHRLDNKKLVEIRSYEDGIFKSHYFLINDEKYHIEHVGLDIIVEENENWVDIEIKDDYFKILELTNFGFKEEANKDVVEDIKATTQKSNQFLKNALLSFGYYNEFEVWNSLKGNQAIQFGKFKVRKYTYTKNEKEQLAKLKDQSLQIKESLANFFSNSQIEIGKLNFETLNKYESILKQYQKAYPELDKIVNKLTQPAFEYVDREALLPKFNLEINFNSQLNYTYQEEQITEKHRFPEIPEQNNLSIPTLAKLVGNWHKDVVEIEEEVERILEDLSKQEALNEDEEELVARKTELIALYSNEDEKDNYNEFHEDVAEGVIQYTNQVFENYVKLPVDQKKDEIQSTLTCIEKLLNTYTELADIPRKLDRLDDVYTRTSFNPYLMVDMSERIKERIYKAFEDYLFPELMKEIKQDIDCDEFPKHLNDLERLYNRMVELSDQDTSDIEKELRRVRDADEIKQILLK